MGAKVKRKRPLSTAEPVPIWRHPLVVAGVGAGLVLALALIWLLNAQARQAGTPAIPPSTYAGMPAQGRALGSEGAPVQVVEYSDYLCPHCATAHEEIFKPLVSNHISAGQVRFELRPVAFLGEESQRATEAALCAQEQGQFFTYHDRLFAAQRQYGRSGFTQARLESYAAELGLDVDAFSRCLQSRRYAGEVDRLSRQAVRDGVTGTPTFFVNGTKVEGVMPFEQFYAQYIRPFVE
ncbi:MAG: DsbA family protein [Ardenticatenia bacterium]|nr:DsbA family protein [Ardenticatenia bacterium]